VTRFSAPTGHVRSLRQHLQRARDLAACPSSALVIAVTRISGTGMGGPLPQCDLDWPLVMNRTGDEVTDRMLIAGLRRLGIARIAPGTCGHRTATTSPSPPVTDLATARIRRRNVLGGLIHQYERAA
jgi:hypothetical protein